MIKITYYAGRALSPVVLEVDAKDDEATIRLLETVERRFGTVNDPERDKRFDAIIAERERVAKLADAPLAYKEKQVRVDYRAPAGRSAKLSTEGKPQCRED